MARVTMTPSAARQFDGLPLIVRVRMTRILARLEAWPSVSGAKPLQGALAGSWRVRTGDYRIQFRVQGGLIVVERVGHRDGFYED